MTSDSEFDRGPYLYPEYLDYLIRQQSHEWVPESQSCADIA